ncbi:lipopolysaccharide biosynthesis protein [Pandoraea terrae]|uniref:Lipopolysaccharide biosynthesis protein n=1 Tax=Pandoraea terrae TaxID=1537710 RepID=A0A5E4TR79_9BURK|nr:oligosaccharide flippase family protein [Pandoraea terrae]VVD89114.1 lipopolysaccharide biosynthesis protein [Pandoraea terrae]
MLPVPWTGFVYLIPKVHADPREYMPYRNILRNILWMLTERGSQIVGGILVSGLLARSLGAAQFGLFQYGQSLVFLAAALTLLCGSEVVVPRLVGCTEGAQQHVMAHAFVLRLGGAVLAYAALAVYILLATEPALHGVVLWLGVGLLFREPFGIVIAWLQARTFNRPSVKANLSALFVKLALIGTLFWLQAPLVAFAMAYAVEAIVAAALLMIYYQRRVPIAPIRWDPLLLRELLHTGMAFWAGLLLMMIFKRIDQLVLKPLIPLSELGAYAAAMQVTENFVLVAPIIANSLAPQLIFQTTTAGQARRNTWRATWLMIAAGACLGVPIALCAPLIVHLIYGQAFTGAAQILRVSALFGILVFADAALNLALVRRGAGRWVIAKWTCAALAAFVTVYSLAPHIGALAGVLGYGAGYAAALVLGVWLLVRD